MTADPWDEPIDPDAVPDWDTPTSAPEPPDDETTFWREQRDGDTAPYTKRDTSAYADWMAAERRVAYKVPCPVCKVVVGQPCIRVSGNPPQPVHPAEPVRNYPAHTPRLRAARRKINA